MAPEVESKKFNIRPEAETKKRRNFLLQYLLILLCRIHTSIINMVPERRKLITFPLGQMRKKIRNKLLCRIHNSAINMAPEAEPKKLYRMTRVGN